MASLAKARYCIDTSAWIDAYNRTYPARVFGALWERVEQAIEEGIIVVPPQVITELRRQEDDLAKWITKRQKIVREPDMDAIAFNTQIAADFPAWTTLESTENMADPWVISVAKSFRLIVISNERGGSDQNPRIPSVCKKYHISHQTFIGVIVAEGWTFPSPTRDLGGGAAA